MLRTLLLLGSLWFASTLHADLGRVTLEDGTSLRGDLELTPTEIVIRNEAGEARFQRAFVQAIEWLEEPTTFEQKFNRTLFGLKGDDLNGHIELGRLALGAGRPDLAATLFLHVLSIDDNHEEARRLLLEAQDQIQKSRAPASSQATRPSPAAAPLVLNARSINRLKLYEFPMERLSTPVNVVFTRARGQPDLLDLVRTQLREKPDADPDSLPRLDRGQPYEKAQVILRETGMQHADRIQVNGEVPAFSTFRRSVLPLVLRGCGRCHSGAGAHEPRFPSGGQSTDTFVYTTFALLNTWQSGGEPLIDRALPEESRLLKMLLPADPQAPVHPPVTDGKLVPVLRSTRDADYSAILEWISGLRVPAPEYELEYVAPAARRTGSRPATAPASAPRENEPGRP